MSLRVDLMLETERRYQGPVSRRFVTTAGGALGAALVLLWIGFAAQRELSARREMKTLEDDWAKLEVRYKAARQKFTAFAAWQGYQKELKPWSDTRADWASRLVDLHAMVPPSVQLTRVSIRSEWEFIKPPPPVVDPGSEAKPQPPAPAQPARRYYLNITGRAAGDAGGDAVLDLVSKLKDNAGYRGVFDTIKLQRLMRDANPSDAADRSFDIEGLALPRKLE